MKMRQMALSLMLRHRRTDGCGLRILLFYYVKNTTNDEDISRKTLKVHISAQYQTER
jgi:hypothetical protein